MPSRRARTHLRAPAYRVVYRLRRSLIGAGVRVVQVLGVGEAHAAPGAADATTAADTAD